MSNEREYIPMSEENKRRLHERQRELLAQYASKRRKREQRLQLHKDFDIAMRFFDLPPDVRHVAWDSAERRIGPASACYRAIVNSLPRHRQI